MLRADHEQTPVDRIPVPISTMNTSTQGNGQSNEVVDSPIITTTTTISDTVIAVDDQRHDAQATTAATENSPLHNTSFHPFADTFQPSETSVGSLFALQRSSHAGSSPSDTTNNSPEGYSPMTQTRRLSGHQQSNIPYVHSIKNDYPVYPSGYRTPDGTGHGYEHGQGQGHHSHHGQHSSRQHHRGGVLAAIDYEGLDACINEVAMEEKEFMAEQHVSTPLIDGSKAFSDKDSKEYTRSLDRAASTGSTSVFGSGFRCRSARKASFYGERAPRVSQNLIIWPKKIEYLEKKLSMGSFWQLDHSTWMLTLFPRFALGMVC